MAAKKSTDVMIAGKVYTLSGYEEEGYLQRVASYINARISEITDRDEFRRIPNEMKSILIELNIADDYFKVRAQFENMEENFKKAEKDLFDLKHELVDAQMRVEDLIEQLEREKQANSKNSENEAVIKEKHKKLEDKYQLLLGKTKVAEEKNRQFEELLRISEQEKRSLDSENKELRLNKERLEAALEDVLLGVKEEEPKKEQKGSISEIKEEVKEAEIKETEESEKQAESISESELSQIDEAEKEQGDISKSKKQTEDNSKIKEEPGDEQLEDIPKSSDIHKEKDDDISGPVHIMDEEEELLIPDISEQESKPVHKKGESGIKIMDWDTGPAVEDAAKETEIPGTLSYPYNEEDDPELVELARQIAELEREERKNKSKKKAAKL